MEIITTHINADFDCLGSMVAALKLYPEAHLLFPGSQEKKLREFIRDESLDLPFIRMRSVDWEDVTLLVLVDARNPKRIGQIARFIDPRRTEIHIYDHHPSQADDYKGQIEIVADVGAAVTLFTEIIKEKKIPLTPVEATIMALAIYEDTGNFVFPSTQSRDLDAASFLLKQGVDLKKVAYYTKKDLVPEQIGLLNELLSHKEEVSMDEGEFSIFTASTEQYVSDIALLAHRIDEMYSPKLFFIFIRLADRISFIARSKLASIDVSEIARFFGGGGHPYAASASIRNMTLIQAKKRLIWFMNTSMPALKSAGDIMTSPVWTVLGHHTLEQAAILLNRYSINNLPVEENDKLIGLISRQTVDKAIFHGLASHRVSDYMSTELFPVDVTASAQEAENMLMENNLRFIPVIDGRKVVGVITRTDILRSIYDDSFIADSFDQQRINTTSIKNVASLMNARLPAEMMNQLKALRDIGKQVKANVYVVGGFVRDLLLSRENLDLDIVVEGPVFDFARHVCSKLNGRMKVHRKFNTAIIICPDGSRIDIAAARTEFYPKPASLPTVMASSIKQDLYRRDFTINALAISLNENKFGGLIDFFGSQRDIKEKTIRVIHSLSFVEDPTRVFRAIRFENRFNFKIGKQTLHFIENAVSNNLFDKLSGKRLMTELKLMLQEDNPSKSIERMASLDVLKFIHPHLGVNYLIALFDGIKEVTTWYLYLYVNRPVKIWILYFIALLEGLERDELHQVLKRLSASKQLKELVFTTRNMKHSVLNSLNQDDDLLPSKIYRTLHLLPTEIILYLMAFTRQENIKKKISYFLMEYRDTKPFLTGEDLKSLGIQPGPLYSKILNHILDLQMDGYINSKDEALGLVREKYINQPLRR